MPAVLEKVKEDKLDLLNDLIDGKIKVKKFCNKCQKDKPLNMFYKDITKTDKLQSYCKNCKIDSIKISKKIIYAQHIKNLKMPSFMKNCSDCKKNKNSYKFRINRSALDGFTSKCKECLSKYEKNNPRKVRSKYDSKRRSLRYILITNGIIDLFVKEYNNQCLYCKRKQSSITDINNTSFYTIDHWIPLSKGGKNKIDNFLLLCHSCNSSKRDKLPEEFFGEHYERINNERLRIISELNISNEIKELIENVGK